MMAARNPFASSIPDIYDPYGMIQSSRAGRLSTGYYVVRNLLLVGALAGGLVALYRNDVFRELARRAGQEPRYLAAETLLVGTPGWGTPRSMEPVLAQSSGAVAPTTEVAAPLVTDRPSVAEMPTAVAPVPPAAEQPAAAPAPLTAAPERAAVAQQAPAAPPPAAAPAAPPSRPIDPLAPVSLDSLPVLTKSGAVSQPVAFDALPASRAAAPTPAARPAPAPADRSKAKATRASLDETSRAGRSIPLPTRAAAPPPAPPPEPPPVARKPEPPKVKTTDVHKNDNPLMAAVRSAVKARPPKE